MSDTTTEFDTTGGFTPAAGETTAASEAGFDFGKSYTKVVGTLNQTLDSVDWPLVSKAAKASGVILAVIIAQILIKGVLDTINLLPIVPGLLELLGLVIVGKWSWQNLSTSDKRNAVIARLQTLRQEYLG
ncbi:MAG: CAAD domain-containing protein [Synechococcus sp.]|nr:CAAD domain-containing protein [Synechococcus sp.]